MAAQEQGGEDIEIGDWLLDIVKKSKCYFTNVRNSVHRNLRHFIGYEMQIKNRVNEGLKEEFLSGVIGYCQAILEDPEEPRIKRRRMRTPKGIETKEVIDA